MGLLFRQKKQQNIFEKTYTFPELKESVQEMLQEYTGTAVSDLESDEYMRWNKEEYQRMISNGIRNCCSGNYGAREVVKELIYSYIQEKLPDQKRVRMIIPFHEPERMSSWQQIEAMIFYYEKEEEFHGFQKLSETFEWNQNGNVISEKEIKQTYLKLRPEYSPEDERKILSQLLFASTVGLGVIDTLNYQKGFIEEIQVGMGGRVERQYDYKDKLLGKTENSSFSRDGIHIMARGSTMWLECLSFETEGELQRVLRNLIKESQGGELTKNHPMLVVDTIDGRRISVSRPPMTDAWVGLIRKFDTVQEVSMEKLYRGSPEDKILPGLLRQLVRSGRNIAITGEMASGKTTLFRACLAEVKKDMNIRVIEADSFELNVRSFLSKANSMTMRITEQTPAEEILAFARKTTGQIFAVGEITSAATAIMAMDLSKIASQLFFSAHYISTEHMIADFVNAKLCVGGYSEEGLAELDVVRCLGFDIHLRAKQGRRYVEYINEIIPIAGKITSDNKSYVIRPIYQWNEEYKQGILLNHPGEISYERAKQQLEQEEYLEFVHFFENKVS